MSVISFIGSCIFVSTKHSICTFEEEVSILRVSTSIWIFVRTTKDGISISFENIKKSLRVFWVDGFVNINFGIFVGASKEYILISFQNVVFGLIDLDFCETHQIRYFYFFWKRSKKSSCLLG